MHPKIKEAYEKIGLLQVPEEMEFFCDFIEWKKPKVILEIGACYGASMMLFCHFAKPQLAISIDMATEAHGRDNVDYEARKKLFDSLEVKSIIEDSHSSESYDKLMEILGDKKIDMLVIDGDHSFEGVFQDYLIYKNLLSKDGFIAFHDITRSVYHDENNCKASYIWEHLKGKLKISIIGNGNGGGGWGIFYP